MPEYLQQTSAQTLAQGLQEYAHVFGSQLRTRPSSPSAQCFFRNHDAVHVVFGCGISLSDEMIVKISSFCGTTGGRAILRGYGLPESKEIYGELDWTEILSATAQSLVIVPRTISRCLRMSHRWPWADFDHHLNKPLTVIRDQFTIRVPH